MKEIKIDGKGAPNYDVNSFTYLCIETSLNNRFVYIMVRGKVNNMGENGMTPTHFHSLSGCAASFMSAKCTASVSNDYEEVENFLKDKKCDI